VRAHSFESAQCIWSRAAKNSKVLGRVSSLDTGGEGGTPCVGVECSHERCSNMTSMYKVVKTVTATKFRHEPFQDFYEVFEEIGSGQFAVVHRVVERSTKTEYAAKYIKKKRVETSRRGVAMGDIEKEIHILAEMENENIIYLHQVYENAQFVILIIELLRGGELFDFIAERERLTEEEASFFIKQILLGVQHLHNHNVAHLDLKPENVMLLGDNSRIIKLIDFGLSRKILPGTEVREMLGTPEFVSPEVVNYEPLSLNTDLWSIGVITYIMLSGLSPFLGDTHQQTYENIVAVDYTFDEEGFENSSDLAKDFIQRLFHKEPRRRGSVWECLNHPWIYSRGPQDLRMKQGGQIHMDNLRNYQARRRWKHSMKVVFLCNRLSRIRLRGSWAGLLDPREHTESPGEGSSPRDSTVAAEEIGLAHKDYDDNFVLSAIFCAIEENNKAGLEELLDVAWSIDINQANKHGECGVHIAAGLGRLEMLKVLVAHGANLGVADQQGDSAVYWAARQGHAPVIRFLVEHGVHVNQQNKLGESCLHAGCKYGHTAVVEYLVSIHTNIDLQDSHKESGLHIAAWHGFPRIVEVLCQAGANLDIKNEDDETPLHVAAARGHIECIRCLLDGSSGTRGASTLDAQDRRGSTSLHLALRRHHTNVALLLLHSGADFDLPDSEGETPIHICAREGMLGLSQTLCAFGCNVDLPNTEGMQPLHLAAKHGNTEVARCLCLAGASIDSKNQEGVAAEVCARVQGHTALGDLLNALRREGGTEEYIEQLIPTVVPIHKIKLKFFGHSGVGKSTLIESLKVGYFSSLFRRSSKRSNRNAGAQVKGEEEGGGVEAERARKTEEGKKKSVVGKKDVVKESRGRKELVDEGKVRGRKGSWHSHIKPPSRAQEVAIGGESVAESDGPASLSSLQSIHDNSTKGIDVLQTNLPGVADVSLWEFSGQECYYGLYDHFIGNTNCIHLVLYSLADPLAVQLEQVTFWLSFLQSRIPPVEPLGDCGRSHKPAFVVLVATHGDLAKNKTSNEELRRKVESRFGNVFTLEDLSLVVDSHAASSQGLKALKASLLAKKQQLIEGLPRTTQFLELVLAALPEWISALQPFPAVTWPAFIDYMHTAVNPLAGEEHLKEVIQQLQLMGEVVYLKCDAGDDIIILDPKWLCGTLCGLVLSPEFRPASCSSSGQLTTDQFQLALPGQPAQAVLAVLQALGLCTLCEYEGEQRWEFPCFARPEPRTNSPVSSRAPEGQVWGGVVLKAAAHPAGPLLAPMFPRVQVQLRRSLALRLAGECSLHQTGGESRLACGPLEGRVSLSDEKVEVVVNSPTEAAKAAFFFLEEILGIIDQVLVEMSPGLPIDKHILSPASLARGEKKPACYSPRSAMGSLQAGGWESAPEQGKETLLQLLCFSDPQVRDLLVPGPELHVSTISTVTRQSLCQLLDPAHPLGKDWCLLAVQMGLVDKVPKLDVGSGAYSQTARLLDEWANQPDSSIGALVTALKTLGREDAADALLAGCSLYRITTAPTGREAVQGSLPLRT